MAKDSSRFILSSAGRTGDLYGTLIVDELKVYGILGSWHVEAFVLFLVIVELDDRVEIVVDIVF